METLRPARHLAAIMLHVPQSRLTVTEALLTPRPATPRLASVLVHAGLSNRSDRRVLAAAELANTFGAKLIGVSTPTIRPLISTRSGIENEATERLVAAAGDRFVTLSASVRGGCHWERVNDSPAAALSALAWAADVILVDHAQPDLGHAWIAEVDELLADSGRPVLINTEDRPLSAFERIIVVWDESAACRRATLAALPFLGRAEGITLLAPPWRRGRQREEQQLEDARRGLLMRGLPMVVARLQEWSAPHVLVPHLQAADADLVVMGAVQEHGPWRGRETASAVALHLRGPVLVCV